MNSLKVIENDLVPVYETDQGEKVVYGSELHDVLGVKSNYRCWIKSRINDCDAIDGIDYESINYKTSSGQTRNDHIIKISLALEICLLERSEKGKFLRKMLCKKISMKTHTKPALGLDKSRKSIYVMMANQLVKIGVSYDPLQRLSELKIGNPFINLIYYSIPVFNAFEIESDIHSILKDNGYWVDGEWFRIDNLDSLYDLINKKIIDKGLAINIVA